MRVVIKKKSWRLVVRNEAGVHRVAPNAKRQTEAADHLVDDVLPLVPYRQMVLSFPILLRYWMQASRKLFAKVHRVVIREMRSHCLP